MRAPSAPCESFFDHEQSRRSSRWQSIAEQSEWKSLRAAEAELVEKAEAQARDTAERLPSAVPKKKRPVAPRPAADWDGLAGMLGVLVAAKTARRLARGAQVAQPAEEIRPADGCRCSRPW